MRRQHRQHCAHCTGACSCPPAAGCSHAPRLVGAMVAGKALSLPAAAARRWPSAGVQLLRRRRLAFLSSARACQQQQRACNAFTGTLSCSRRLVVLSHLASPEKSSTSLANKIRHEARDNEAVHGWSAVAAAGLLGRCQRIRRAWASAHGPVSMHALHVRRRDDTAGCAACCCSTRD